jgi:uncharacterized protein
VTDVLSVARPGPTVSRYNKPYWDAAREKELRLQKCSQCGRFWAPPGPACPFCFSSEFSWDAVSGRGTIASWVKFHKAYHPFFQGKTPYLVAFVELDEGPRLIANIVATGGLEVSTGQEVEVVFEDEDGFTLPQFKIRGT